MMILNCTKKLVRRLPFPAVDDPHPSSNRLGPWCANSFNVGRFSLIILTNERTLLSVVIPFKEIGSFHERFLMSLKVLLHSIGLSPKDMQTELNEMMTFQISRNTNRSTLGSMNDFVYQVRATVFDGPERSLDDVSYRLSEVPCAPLKYGYPREAVLDVLHVHSGLEI